ncbi:MULTISPECIES: hypothetical protein [unclassified Streptomyces]|uniref:hypothetical protein n=1 Tax=unclassified Streptomyces TaxID=2593676 RepID=UPI001661E3EF|nr:MULTISPECIES: hypothetical protein [unclassified Streptomyces]MBD0841328.1 hypothetical protein [Streptomyces sp. TRM68416]
MDPTARDPHDRPFTLVVCATCRDAADDHVMDVLRRAVRACSHGVMISTGCLDRFLHCRSGRGLYAAVQPCAADRRAVGAVVRLGPIATRADAEAVAAWLRAGMPDDGSLAESLLAAPAPRQVAHLN